MQWDFRRGLSWFVCLSLPWAGDLPWGVRCSEDGPPRSIHDLSLTHPLRGGSRGNPSFHRWLHTGPGGESESPVTSCGGTFGRGPGTPFHTLCLEASPFVHPSQGSTPLSSLGPQPGQGLWAPCLESSSMLPLVCLAPGTEDTGQCPVLAETQSCLKLKGTWQDR